MVAAAQQRHLVRMAVSTANIQENLILAASLREMAELLERQGANHFRSAAYSRAAQVVERLEEPASAILGREGRRGLDAQPAIGPSIAAALAELLNTGRWPQLERLRGSLEPERLLQTVPGIGPTLAHRICDGLDIESLEELEVAAFDGRLARLPAFGPRRMAMVQTHLAERLGRPRLYRKREAEPRPSIALILDVDREYRSAAMAGDLPLIAPRRFNPDRKPWLPILHTRRGDWDFTALYSNSRRAHSLGKSRDWVVVSYFSDALAGGQCTVVTETRGPGFGCRVVRGREPECAELFERRRVMKNPAAAAIMLSDSARS
jgi:hypothetical protein